MTRFSGIAMLYKNNLSQEENQAHNYINKPEVFPKGEGDDGNTTVCLRPLARQTAQSGQLGLRPWLQT